MTALLAHSIVGESAYPKATAFIVHGVLGAARNMMGFAKALSMQHPHWRFVVLDLRNHGHSTGFIAPHTLEACAEDLWQLGVQVGEQPQAVIGHSFGGKVALAYAKHVGESLQSAWILDCMPGPHDLKAVQQNETSITQLIPALQTLTLPLTSRKLLADALIEQGIARKVALWMTTNLRETPEGLVWAFDLPNIVHMLHSYGAADYWPLLEHKRPTAYHIVHAERGYRWDAAALQRLSGTYAQGHLLPNSGHWVHVDNLPGLLKIMQPYF